MKKRTVLNSPHLKELKRKRRRVVIRKTLIILVVLILFVGILFYFTRNSVFKITGEEVTGNKIVDTEAILQKIQDELTGNYLWIIPKTNILFYPKEKIKKSLENNFTRLSDIKLSVNNKKVLQVEVSERVGVYTWCGEIIPEKINATQKCYFLDKNGFLFDNAPFFSGEVYLKFYGLVEKKEGLPAPAYFASLNKQNFGNLISFKDAIIGLGLKPAAFYMSPDGDIEIFLSGGSKSPTGPKLLLKADADYQKVAENLDAAISTEPLQSGIKNKYSLLQYIDLRYGNKVYFKFSDGTAAAPVAP
ncbi:MAG: hypothetical protein ABIS26_01670 [Candidatus Paceibacterota bacterium]